MFQVGDKILYPMHGAGVIEAIEEKEVLGENNLYYFINIPHINTQLMIPIKKAASLGIRKIVQPAIIDRILKAFYDEDTDPNIYANQRYCVDINKKKIRSGDIHQSAEIIRDLIRKGHRVKLGAEDLKILSSARQIFVSELVQVKEIDEDEAIHLLDQIVESYHEKTS